MPVYYGMKAFIFVLELYPVFQSPEIVSQVQFFPVGRIPLIIMSFAMCIPPHPFHNIIYCSISFINMIASRAFALYPSSQIFNENIF